MKLNIFHSCHDGFAQKIPKILDKVPNKLVCKLMRYMANKTKIKIKQKPYVL